MMKKQVLFLCTGNSARSQLAEAIFNHMAGDRFHADSAGVHPSEVDPRVFEVLDGQNITSEGLRSKDYAEVESKHYDFVITLCDNAKDECVIFEQDVDQLHWNLVDPKPLEGVKPFKNTAKELMERISLFLLLNSEENNTHVDPSSFFKLMSDPLRLKILMLLEDEQDLTVTDLKNALNESQPKVSRHLALLRDTTFLKDTRQGLWIHYRLSPSLPMWIKHLLQTVRVGNPGIINVEKSCLKAAQQNEQ
ncbi:metalloregulator ArsR/SmtB family transcription factor [Vibrio owensii]|uniref:Phosphotyrosine protein phosphatase n=1 Tax=Vibrio owensii CAIM 1854 = LMG 25443 TaxID=1229493 RepID=A0A0C1ZDC0_9VIBR|nr:metalloregulator ArsR/SmtB family transcription factor [Vibrio owensii]KIF51051.1 phosphotyrosine protein phosphatase [Vibrio owensii CAIM 1854 = LMG 25443]